MFKHAVRGFFLFAMLTVAAPASADIEEWGYHSLFLSILKDGNKCDFLGINKQAADGAIKRILEQVVNSTYDVEDFKDVQDFAEDWMDGQIRKGGWTKLCQEMRRELRPKYPGVFSK